MYNFEDLFVNRKLGKKIDFKDWDRMENSERSFIQASFYCKDLTGIVI